jgi:hypothetical protein
MKTLQHLCLAVVFTLTLTTVTFAGEIGTGGKTPPPPPPDSATATTSAETPLEPKDDADYEYQLMEDITLQLLRTMLSVF